MKKWTFLLLSLGLALPLLGGERGITKDKVTIGSHTSLSGPAAIWGVGSIAGARLYFDAVNAAGGVHGRKIDYLVEDHQYQVPRAIQVANKLINRDKIFAMIGALGTPMNNAVMKEQMRNNVPNLFPYTAARSMTHPYHKLKVGFLSSYYAQTRKGLNYFIKEKKKAKICAIYQDTDYGQEIRDAIDEELKANKLSLLAYGTHKPTEISFEANVGKMKKAGCDLIILGTIIKDTIQILGTAKKFQVTADFFGSLASYDNIVAGVKGSLTEGYYVASPYPLYYEDNRPEKAKKFFDDYKSLHKKAPGMSAQVGYTFAQLFAEGLKRAGKDLTVDKLMKSFTTMTDYKTDLYGTNFNLNSKRDYTADPFILAQVKNGRWVATKNLTLK